MLCYMKTEIFTKQITLYLFLLKSIFMKRLFLNHSFIVIVEFLILIKYQFFDVYFT